MVEQAKVYLKTNSAAKYSPVFLPFLLSDPSSLVVSMKPFTITFQLTCAWEVPRYWSKFLLQEKDVSKHGL